MNAHACMGYGIWWRGRFTGPEGHVDNALILQSMQGFYSSETPAIR